MLQKCVNKPFLNGTRGVSSRKANFSKELSVAHCNESSKINCGGTILPNDPLEANNRKDNGKMGTNSRIQSSYIQALDGFENEVEDYMSEYKTCYTQKNLPSIHIKSHTTIDFDSSPGCSCLTESTNWNPKGASKFSKICTANQCELIN